MNTFVTHTDPDATAGDLEETAVAERVPPVKTSRTKLLLLAGAILLLLWFAFNATNMVYDVLHSVDQESTRLW